MAKRAHRPGKHRAGGGAAAAAPSGRLTPQQVEDLRLASVLKRMKAGKALTAQDEAVLARATGGAAGGGGPAAPSVEVGDDGEPVYLSKLAFEKWLPSQGITISHKNLYKTYLGPAAPNPVIYNSDGTKVHKWKSLEILRMVRERTQVEPDTFAARRREADIRTAEARAHREQIELQTMRGERVFVVQVEKKWEQLIQKLKNGLRNIENSLPADVRAEVRGQHHELLSSLSVSFRPTPN